MRSQANSGRLDKELEVGSWVWLRLQPYRQHSIRGSHHNKFAKRYFGPYQIARRIGSVAYELILPAAAHIHPVFHISKLKPFFGVPPTTVPALDATVTGTLVTPQPVQLLGTRHIRSSKGNVLQVLVQWEGLSAAKNTWENWKELLESYPHCNLEDKIELDGVGNDTKVLIGKETYVDDGPAEGVRGKSSRPNRERKAPAWARDYVGMPPATN